MKTRRKTTSSRKKSTTTAGSKSRKKSATTGKKKSTADTGKTGTKKKKGEPFPCYGSHDPDDGNCVNCPDEDDCIKEAESLEDDLEEEDEDSEIDEAEDEEFDPESLDLDDEDERVETLSELSDDELLAVAEHYKIDVDDDAERSELLLAIDGHFDEEEDDLDEDEEEDDLDDEEEEEEDDDLDEDEEEADDENVSEEAVRTFLYEIESAMKELTKATTLFKEWLDSDSEDDDELEEEDDEDEEGEEYELPDYFAPYVEKKGCKVVNAGRGKFIAKKGLTHWASVYFDKDGDCHLVFNNGQLSNLPGTTKLKVWDNHPSINAYDDNAKKLLMRHFKMKAAS